MCAGSSSFVFAIIDLGGAAARCKNSCRSMLGGPSCFVFAIFDFGRGEFDVSPLKSFPDTEGEYSDDDAEASGVGSEGCVAGVRMEGVSRGLVTWL